MQATRQKTTLAQPKEVKSKWYLVDASEQTLGRMAAKIAVILMGKHRCDYTPHVDTGDYVVVVNSEKIKLSGKKALTKTYDYYTYYTGGHKYVSVAEMLKKKPEKVITEAVRRMLPKSKMGGYMLKKLKVYRGSDHPHAAQQPKPLE